jgi:hypothetical protein
MGPPDKRTRITGPLDALATAAREEQGRPVQALGLHLLIEAGDDDGRVGLARRLDPLVRDGGLRVLPDPLQRRDEPARLARVVADHGDGGGEGQRGAVPAAPVLEQDDGLARGVEGERLVRGRADVGRAEARERLLRAAAVEHAEAHLHEDGVGERGVDVGVGDLPLRDGGLGVLGQERAAVEVEAGCGCSAGRGRTCRRSRSGRRCSRRGATGLGR